MAKRVRILEKRVEQAVDRLRELSGERERLRQELTSLRAEWEESTDAQGGEATSGAESEEWTVRRQEAISLIRETLSELRAD